MVDANLGDYRERQIAENREKWRNRIARRQGVVQPLSQSRIPRAISQFISNTPVLGGKRRGWHSYIDEAGTLQVRSRLGQYLVNCARMYEAMATYRDRLLLDRYLTADKPLHLRRTLHRAFMPSKVGDVNTRDWQQVVHHFTAPNPNFPHEYGHGLEMWPDHILDESPCESCALNIGMSPKVIVVDQLWMWILDRHTIITCFPNRHGSDHDESAEMHSAIRSELRASSNAINSAFDVALAILDGSFNYLLDPESNPAVKLRDRKPPVFEAFEEALTKLSRQGSLSREKLYQVADVMQTLHGRGHFQGRSVESVTWATHAINPESFIRGKLQDMTEELRMMLNITETHEQTLESLKAQVGRLLDSKSTHRQRGFEGGQDLDNGFPSLSSSSNSAGDPGKGKHKHVMSGSVLRDEETLRRFATKADEVMARIRARKARLDDMLRAADNLSASILEFLTVKQHTMATADSWRSQMQSTLTYRQSTAIVMFTVVTVIFAPLSFMSSVFGMSAAEFANDSWSLGEQFRLLCKSTDPPCRIKLADKEARDKSQSPSR
jgi:Mg2+ and Co2+ transporter CorA